MSKKFAQKIMDSLSAGSTDPNYQMQRIIGLCFEAGAGRERSAPVAARVEEAAEEAAPSVDNAGEEGGEASP